MRCFVRERTVDRPEPEGGGDSQDDTWDVSSSSVDSQASIVSSAFSEAVDRRAEALGLRGGGGTEADGAFGLEELQPIFGVGRVGYWLLVLRATVSDLHLDCCSVCECGEAQRGELKNEKKESFGDRFLVLIRLKST